MPEIAVFESMHALLRADKIMNRHSVPHGIRPVPRHISSDCGMTIVFDSCHRQAAAALLSNAAITVNFHKLEQSYEF